MNGLDLEPFLRLLRADVGVWVSLAAIVIVVALMTWTSWGSRRALRKCLILSILVHMGLLLYGGGLDRSLARGEDEDPVERTQDIRIVGDEDTSGPDGPPSRDGVTGRRVADWDKPRDLPLAAEDPLRVAHADPAPPPTRAVMPEPVAMPELSTPALPDAVAPAVEAESPPDVPVASAAPATAGEIPEVSAPAEATSDADPAPERVRPDRPAPPPRPATPRPRPEIAGRSMLPAPSLPATGDGPQPAPDESVASTAPDRPAPDGAAGGPVEVASGVSSPAADAGLPETDLRTMRRRPAGSAPAVRSTAGLAPVTIARVAPSRSTGPMPPLPSVRPLADVPEVYRERLDPDRSARARRAGASEGSERAVERALDWLARHQDADGRWNAGTRTYKDDTPLRGETSFTMHCPPGETCSGECFYYESDTAMTGLSLLAYLGAGYTHTQTEGKYAGVVGRGLQFLLRAQKPNGDLRGESRTVGMYCHAMASLAICEAYALSGDPALRGPAERAVDFLIKSRATDGLSWRYSPGLSSGDTSLLGWAILVFKSAQQVGIPVPAKVRTGALGWLDLVAEGRDGGLAVYRPNEGPYGSGDNNPPYVPGRNITPTMTAEAWVCRQFLGVGGPGPASDEAARYLIANRPDRDIYYWYYGTLSMFQRGGDDWALWNSRVRDAIVSLQKADGHQAGSWDPKDCRGRYDAKGGRIYCTALATMTLEVYYRYVRLPDGAQPASSRMAPRSDSTLRRTGERRARP